MKRIHINKEAVKNTGMKALEYTAYIAVGVLGFMGTVLAASAEIAYENRTIGYNDTIETIVNSDMSSYYKTQIIDMTKRDMDETYYKSIINVVKSNMSDYYKVDTIKRIK